MRAPGDDSNIATIFNPHLWPTKWVQRENKEKTDKKARRTITSHNLFTFLLKSSLSIPYVHVHSPLAGYCNVAGA